MFKQSRNRYPFKNKIVATLAAVALTTSAIAPGAFANEAPQQVAKQEVQFETYYKYGVNSVSFAMLNTKPAIVEQTTDGYKVTVQVSGYSIFTKFEIDGQQGVAGTTFDEPGTDRNGNPTTVTYTPVTFMFDSIDDVKQATVAYTAGTFSMSHDLELDFTPGEYDPSVIKPETYYKGEVNSSHFSSLTGAVKASYASKKYTVTIDVPNYIFTKFEIDGQAGIQGEPFTAKGQDRTGNEVDVTYTPVTFTFDDMENVKKAVVAYNAGTREMSHEFEMDFTPGEYDGAIEQAIESYYNYTTNSTHFSSITSKPAKISTKDGISTVTLAVSNYDIFTKFEIDGQAGKVVGTFEEDGTNFKGEPAKVTYTNVAFTFNDIKAVKDAVIAYKAGAVDMSHDFKLDFTPGEYKANEIAFNTYYKGEANTASFKAVNGKPAIVTVKADKTYDVTLQVSGYDIFNTFTIDGQTGVIGEPFTEKGTDRQGNEVDVVYTPVTFNFSELNSAKKAVLGYQAGQTAMTHEYDIDFTPGDDYEYIPPAEALYDGKGEKLSHTLVGDAAARFNNMLGNSYAEKTTDGYNIFIELKSADILSTFTINGKAPSTLKEEKESNTKVVSITVKDLQTPLNVQAAVKYAPTNISAFTIELASAAVEEAPQQEQTLVNTFANGFYDASVSFDKDTGNSFIQQNTQLFFMNDVAYLQLAIKQSGIEYININDVKQTPTTTVTVEEKTNDKTTAVDYNVYTVKVDDITKALAVDLSVNIPNVYQHVYEDLALNIQDVKQSTATTFTYAKDIVKPITVTENATSVLLLTTEKDAPLTNASVKKTADNNVQFTLTPTDDRLQKVTSKDGKTTFYNKPTRTPQAVEAISFTAPSIDDVAFVYTDAEGKEKTAALTAAVEVDRTVIDTAVVEETTPEVVVPETTTPEKQPETTTPPTTSNTTPPTTGGGTAVQSESGTYSANISFGSTGDSFLSPTATVIKDGNQYKVRVVIQGASAIQSFNIKGSTEVAKGVYEFTTTSLTGITASMHVVVPEADYEHTYNNIQVTLSLGSKLNNDTVFPAPPTTNDTAIIPPGFSGGSTSNTPGATAPSDEQKEKDTTEETTETTETEETPTDEQTVENEEPLPTAPASQFTDVTGEYAEHVQALYTAGITTGTTATTFSPQANMTRAQFAVMIARALNASTTAATTFTDVQGKWYASHVQALAEIGIVTGTTASTFEPGATLTRQQAAVMLYRYLQHKGYTSSATVPTFNDTAAISDYAKPAFATLQQLNILTGDQNNANPNQKLTRGQMAKLLSLTLQAANTR